MTRLTYLERRWPHTPLFQQVARRWCEDQSYLLLDLVWRGCDRLLAEDLSAVCLCADDEAKEESLNHLVAVHIDQCKSGDEPFYVDHQPPEQTKRKRGRGKSPQPDIGFTLYEFPRTIWPLEAKIMADEEDVGPYLAEIEGNFLTGRYATFSSEGAMLGYLLRGEVVRAFAILGDRLRQTPERHPRFPDRPHRVSNHRRQVQQGGPPRLFTCHHLLLRIPANVAATAHSS